MRPNAGAGPACKYADTTPLSAANLRSGSERSLQWRAGRTCAVAELTSLILERQRELGTKPAAMAALLRIRWQTKSRSDSSLAL